MARNLAHEPKRPMPLGGLSCRAQAMRLEQAMHLGYRSARQAKGLASPGRWRS
jgi:hypothetical protein